LINFLQIPSSWIREEVEKGWRNTREREEKGTKERWIEWGGKDKGEGKGKESGLV